MRNIGIRISDTKGKILTVGLSDILAELHLNDSYYWSILFLDGAPKTSFVNEVGSFQDKVNSSVNVIIKKHNELVSCYSKYDQVYETIIVGCKDRNFCRRYDTEAEMIQTCDIVILLIDCTCWEVYIKDTILLKRLEQKFENTEQISVDLDHPPSKKPHWDYDGMDGRARLNTDGTWEWKI